MALLDCGTLAQHFTDNQYSVACRRPWCCAEKVVYGLGCPLLPSSAFFVPALLFFLILELWTTGRVCAEDIGRVGSGLAPELLSAAPWR